MGERASLTIQDILYQYGQRIESYLGRCEILRLVAESIREEQPKVSRAISTIAEDMAAEIVSISDEIEIFLHAAQQNSISGSVDLDEFSVLRTRARTEWAQTAGRPKPAA